MNDRRTPVACAVCGEAVAEPRIEYKMGRFGRWTVVHPACFDRRLADDPNFRELRYITEPQPLYILGEEQDMRDIANPS